MTFIFVLQLKFCNYNKSVVKEILENQAVYFVPKEFHSDREYKWYFFLMQKRFSVLKKQVFLINIEC